MKTLIAVKAFGRTPPGGTFLLNDRDARVVVALGLAAYAPPPKPKAEPKAEPKVTPKTYQRRDMVAETVTAPRITGTIAIPAARFSLPESFPQSFKTDDGKAKE